MGMISKFATAWCAQGLDIAKSSFLHPSGKSFAHITRREIDKCLKNLTKWETDCVCLHERNPWMQDTTNVNSTSAQTQVKSHLTQVNTVRQSSFVGGCAAQSNCSVNALSLARHLFALLLACSFFCSFKKVQYGSMTYRHTCWALTRRSASGSSKHSGRLFCDRSFPLDTFCQLSLRWCG